MLVLNSKTVSYVIHFYKGRVNMKKFLVLILAVLMVGSLFASGASESGAAAEKERKLVIYSALSEDETKLVTDLFEQKTGIKTSAICLGGGEILSRIRAEKGNPVASIYWGGSCDAFIQAANEGLLLQYESPQLADIDFYDKNHYWTCIYSGYVSFVSNNERLAELGISAPTSWYDLLDPRLEGEIMMPSPATAGTGYVAVASILQNLGLEEGWDYITKLDKNMFQYTERGSACIPSVIAGEVAVGICYAHDQIKNQKAGYQDLLTVTLPKEGTGAEIGAMAIIAAGPDQDEAKEFYEFALTPEAQEIRQQAGALQFLSNKNSKAPAEAQALVGVRPVKYDPVWAGENKKDIVAKWQQITGR